MNPNMYISELDEIRFGIRSARVTDASLESVDDILEFAREKEVVFMIARCSVDNLSKVQALEKVGFRLMDTLVYWKLDMKKKPVPQDTNLERIRLFRLDDTRAIEAVATQAFHDYYGHYHADPRLDKHKCDEVYIDWAVRSVHDRSMAEEVLVAEINQQVVGFATLRRIDKEEGEIIYSAVLPSAQGHGIYRSFITAGAQWIHKHDMQFASLSTQITNTAVQRVWARLGFEFHKGYYTLHKWFDEG